jgi:hypothetical protein
MIVLYSVVWAFLNALRCLALRRARSLERKFTRIALATTRLAQQAPRPGNNRADLSHTARQQYELGLLALKRDRLESRHFAWQLRLERLTKRLKALHEWRGRKLPYVLGVLDVALLFGTLNHFGLVDVDFSQLVKTVHSLGTR